MPPLATSRPSPLRVTRTRDAGYINSVLSHPAIFEATRDDSCPASASAIDAALFVNRPGYIFLKVGEVSNRARASENRKSKIENPLGLFMLEPQGRGHIVHTCLLPECRGARAIRAGKLGVAWMFTRTPTAALVSHCWETRPEVLWFAKRVGFEPRTFAPWPFRVNGAQIFSTGVCLTRERWQHLQLKLST